MALPISLDHNRIAEFCRRWKIVEFALFGSVIRDDFRPDSDVDVLIAFSPDARWSLFDRVDLEDELRELVGREIHVVEMKGLRNPFRRDEILRTRQVIYAA